MANNVKKDRNNRRLIFCELCHKRYKFSLILDILFPDTEKLDS